VEGHSFEASRLQYFVDNWLINGGEFVSKLNIISKPEHMFMQAGMFILPVR
jgi:hypothetical protein